MPQDQLLKEEDRWCLLFLRPRCLQEASLSLKAHKGYFQPNSNYQITGVKVSCSLSTQNSGP